MSSLPSTVQSADRAQPCGVHARDTAPELTSTSDRTPASTGPATRAASHQRSEGSEATKLGGFHGAGVSDDTSSITLPDGFACHPVGMNKSAQRIPSSVISALLQGVASSLDGEAGDARDGHRSRDDVPRYSAAEKEKWNVEACGDVVDHCDRARCPSPQFHFDSIYSSPEDWVVHNRPILRDYADRQTSLPLGRRLEVTIDEPPQFILGAIQLLANRDQRGCTDPLRRLGPQLIENFVDIDLWAKEYFRSRHCTQVGDSNVPALLTIIMNNFYDGLVHLIDRLVEFALENMRVCGRSSLAVEDFAFGFDFKMSQDLPFYVETSSRIRKPLPIRAVKVRPTSEPVTTKSGRRVKPTERAEAAAKEAREKMIRRQHREENIPRFEDDPAETAPGHQKKSSAQTSSQRTDASVSLQTKPHPETPAPPKTTSEHMKHGPVRSSDLTLPLISPGLSSTVGTDSSQSDGACKPEHRASSSADAPKVSGSSGSSLVVKPPPRIKIRHPPPSIAAASTVPATSVSESTSREGPIDPPVETLNRWRGALRSRGARPRGPRNGRGDGRERGSTSATLDVEIREAAPDRHPVDAGMVEEASAAVVAPPFSPVDGLGSAVVGTTFRPRYHGR